jgi:hypothetical protein
MDTPTVIPIAEPDELRHETLWLFGSWARGDADSASDIDVLLVGDDRGREIRPAGVSLTRYTWEEIEGLASQGSLFLHHVHTEGIPLVDGPMNERLKVLLTGLPKYRRARADVAAFSTILHDVIDASHEDCSTPFEMSLVGAVLRHSSVLGCHLIDRPTYGRRDAFLVARSAMHKPPLTIQEFDRAYAFRLWAAGRGSQPTSPKQSELRDCGLRALSWVSRIEEFVDESN